MRSATATLVLPGFAEKTPPPPPGRTLPQMAAHATSAATPAPLQSRGKRRAIGLVVMLGLGVAVGGAAAVLEDVLAPKRVHALAPRAVIRALHPLGTMVIASRAFATDVTDSGGFTGLGDEVVYHGAGTVSASVDFARVHANDVRVISAEDRPRVRVMLPDVQLGAPVLDEAHSGVIKRRSGILDTLFGPPASEDELRSIALDDLATSADASTLRAQARGAAVAEVRSTIVGLGAKVVQVDFISSG
jgi:hypothetical protein